MPLDALPLLKLPRLPFALDEAEPAHGGRFEELFRAGWLPVCERLLEPKPCGARPESTVLPCALNPREEDPAPPEVCGRAEGGRFAESCDERPLLFKPAEELLRVPAEEELNERTDVVRAAAAAGVVRATTLRFCTLADGRETFAPKCEAPRELALFGVA